MNKISRVYKIYLDSHQKLKLCNFEKGFCTNVSARPKCFHGLTEKRCQTALALSFAECGGPVGTEGPYPYPSYIPRPQVP